MGGASRTHKKVTVNICYLLVMKAVSLVMVLFHPFVILRGVRQAMRLLSNSSRNSNLLQLEAGRHSRMAKVLVVEDSPTVASVLEHLLRLDGHTVYTARDGMTALTSLRAYLPDLVLLDILLPHVNGFDLCAAIRRQSAYQSLPIIMVSSLADETAIQCAFAVGADAYFTKPFGEAALLATIDQHLYHDSMMELAS
jgi:CheY-like chemotaxis protein